MHTTTLPVDPLNTAKAKGISFIDKVMGRHPIAPRETKDPFACNLMRVEFEVENPLLPKISIDDNYFCSM